MALYFLVLDSQVFRGDISLALAASWRGRSFEPCRAVCAKVLPAAREFANRYHLGDSEPLLASVSVGLPFDRVFWQHLAGELLWFSATDIPELQTNLAALVRLLAPEQRDFADVSRSKSPAIIQAHHGSRDLVFGGGYYRLDHAGLNDGADVSRLASYLESVRPELWRPEDLAGVADIAVEDREEELTFLRDWFPALAELYVQAAAKNQVIVCETLE